MTLRCSLVFAFLFVASVRLSAEPKTDINVNVTLTEEGKKIPRPTSDNPAYYLAGVIGFREEGNVIAGEKAPNKEDVVGALKKALAGQGYLEGVPGKGITPSLLIVFQWGYLNPDNFETGTTIDETSGAAVGLTAVKNKDTLVALVSGRNLDAVDDINGIKGPEEVRAMQEAADERYFLIVSAYDFETAVKEKKKKLLWIARTSTPARRVSSLADVLPTMIKTATPYFGVEAMPPVREYVPFVREGTVGIGPVTVGPDKPEETAPKKTKP